MQPGTATGDGVAGPARGGPRDDPGGSTRKREIGRVCVKKVYGKHYVGVW